MNASIYFYLTLSWLRPLSYRNQSIDLLRKSMDWFLYDNGLRQERVKASIHRPNIDLSELKKITYLLLLLS